ncbi:hypothetical protein NW762_014365 [Fusarium torreyae]|uniref:Uncharacterized protein n=1 Tax=Fusarium torreyae TaxID=1237075 RepID=A0A9W8RKH9_9HYPO|nr:hypothetical protein NW762_014365 [Fusarium torreyae]
MSPPLKVAPWQQRPIDGFWSRPLIGPERMFDQWLEINGWAEWTSAVVFTVAPSLTSKTNTDKGIKTWFNQAISLLCLEKPSLLAFIERGKEGSAASKSRNFVYRPLESDDDLAGRIARQTTILHTKKSVQDGLKTLTDEFYKDPERRISLELGEHLIHISLVASSAEPGSFGLAIRCNHALNDSWSGIAILHDILGKLADGLTRSEPWPSYKIASPSALHPCYLDILQKPIGDDPLDQESQEKAKHLLGANLENITFCPVSQEPAKDLPDTDYCCRRQVFTQEQTQKIVQICKAQGVSVTALLTALQTFALLETFPPEDSSRTKAAPICVSNRLRHTSLTYDNQSSSQLSLHQTAKEAAAIGPIMATTFLVSPFDVSPYLQHENKSNGSRDWRKDIWEVARNAGRATDDAIESNISEHVDWTQGPAAFGGVAHALEAMKAGLAPSPPGILTPLSSIGLLDGIHIRETYGDGGQSESPALKLVDFVFYSRVNKWFGPQVWAWTALEKLNTIMVMPDPRIRSVPNIEWWDLFNDMIAGIATGDPDDVQG